jgi:hypothetical protein
VEASGGGGGDQHLPLFPLDNVLKAVQIWVCTYIHIKNWHGNKWENSLENCVAKRLGNCVAKSLGKIVLENRWENRLSGN